MRAAIGSIVTGAEASHSLLHIVADGGQRLEVQRLRFASRWVVEEFVRRATREEPQGLASLLSTASGALRGELHEAAMHAVLQRMTQMTSLVTGMQLADSRLLPQGGRFTVVRLDPDTFERRSGEEVLELKSCKEVRFFKDLADVIDGGRCGVDGVYYRPSDAGCSPFDAIRPSTDAYDFFQIAADVRGSEWHQRHQHQQQIDLGELGGALGAVRLPPGATPRLFHVVPCDTFAAYKVQTKKVEEGAQQPQQGPSVRPGKAAGTGVKRPMRLYILKGAIACLRAQALPPSCSGRPRRPAAGVRRTLRP
ncbi:hypothetical protein GPECTOR_20g458 [Gonium pectorale]|uniref:Uncharacterized protein n=1 Tax=Gonium pectorale TaxID=33097 RepID=A0A150GIF9_GONPE|nr:hypothetical protein GPECTOR_20g458 [Gonium pectorale]|eukprot:KXZ49602.1 hypothetical protein GPECTOR_20g458 [Gonium pectorale]